MGEQLGFDEDIASKLDAVYRTRDILRRRGLVLDALDARPGETVVDLGCGPGFYVADLLERLGGDCTVVAVDPAPAMRAMTQRRIAGAASVSVVEGSATDVPLPDGAADRALSVQVLEYVDDIAAALAELRRVVRPGGRVVLWDVDWSTLSWHAQDPERMRRMCEAWDRHLVHRALPRTLRASLLDAGFEDVVAEGHVFVTTAMDPEAFGGYLPAMIAEFVGRLDDPDAQADAPGWLDDLRELDGRGAYFFSVTQFCFSATRPPG